MSLNAGTEKNPAVTRKKIKTNNHTNKETKPSSNERPNTQKLQTNKYTKNDE